MGDTIPLSTPPGDRAAECHTRAAADRDEAEAMASGRGRNAMAQSAASWDERGALLGRLDASFDKRARLDAEALRFHADRRAERCADAAGVSQWEGEGGAMSAPRPSGADPGVRQAGAGPTRPAPAAAAAPTSLQVLGQAGLTAIIALPVMILAYRWFAG